MSLVSNISIEILHVDQNCGAVLSEALALAMNFAPRPGIFSGTKFSIRIAQL
jgi:hypothetical protein